MNIFPPSTSVVDLEKELNALTEEERDHIDKVAGEFIFRTRFYGADSQIQAAWSGVFGSPLNDRVNDEAAYTEAQNGYITDMCYIAAIKQYKIERKDKYFQREDAA